MADLPIFHLGGSWWLCHDQRQWILAKAFKQPPGAVKTTPGAQLRAVAYIASTKDVLLRVIVENEIPLTAEARAKLGALPDTFKAWRRQYNRASTSTHGTIERAA